MDYTTLGRTGITVSKLCLGMMSFGNSQEWQLEIDEARPIIERAVELGINFFDTANVYSRGRSEEITGEVLSDYREDVVVATKVRFRMREAPNAKGLNRAHMRRAIERSLDRLNMDYVDLYQIHRWDANTDIELIMRSLNQLIESGKTTHIGASSMFAWQLSKAQYIAKENGLEQFVSMQNHYNAIYREEEREMIPLCKDMNMGIIPWSPLGRGFLSGKYDDLESADSPRFRSDPYLKARYFNENDFEVLQQVKQGAKENDISTAQMALKWVLSKPYITSPIIGVSKIEHLEEAVETIDISVDQDYLNRIDEAYTVRPIIGHSYQLSDDMVSSKNE